jgi:hypothetical protein
MSDLLHRIKQGVKNHKTIPFPGSDNLVKMYLLSEKDTFEATVAAEQLFRSQKVEINFHNVNAYENEKAVQMLYRSLIDPENNEPITESITEFRKLLTNEDRNLLIEEYNSLVEECSPSPKNMSIEEYDRLVELLKKNPVETIGNCSSLLTLKKLSMYLAEQLQSLQKDNGPTSL